MESKTHSAEAQFLTAQVLTSHGLNSACRVVSADGKCISELGLHPLVLVCLAIPAFGVQLKRLFPVGGDVSLSGFLAEQWYDRQGIFALPKVIQVTQDLVPCDAGLFDWIEGIGVDVVVVSENVERSLSLSEPTVNQLHSEFTFGNEDMNRVVVDIDRANASLECFSKSSVDLFYYEHNASELQAFQSFQLRERRFLEPDLIAASSDVKFDFLCPRTVTQSVGALRIGGGDFPDRPAVCIAELAAYIACWPVDNSAMFKWAGIELQELQAFFARQSALGGRKLYRLYEYLRVDASGGPYPIFVGGNILIANDPPNVDVVVNSLTHDGAWFAFFEVSNSEAISGKWRIALLWGPNRLPSAILFERGSKEAKLLDGRHWPRMGQRELCSSLVNDLRWSLENLEVLAGFARFGTFLRGKHSEYLCTLEENAR